MNSHRVYIPREGHTPETEILLSIMSRPKKYIKLAVCLGVQASPLLPAASSSFPVSSLLPALSSPLTSWCPHHDLSGPLSSPLTASQGLHLLCNTYHCQKWGYVSAPMFMFPACLSAEECMPWDGAAGGGGGCHISLIPIVASGTRRISRCIINESTWMYSHGHLYFKRETILAVLWPRNTKSYF